GGDMKAAPFQRHAPTTVDEAVDLLGSVEDATILAGGQSLVPIMRFRLAEPSNVIDINGVSGLDHLEESDGQLRIGALVRHADVDQSDLIADRYGSFADTAPLVAEPQVRNRGTVVGSVAQADPKGDWGSVLLAHEGEVVARGAEGERTIPADEFFVLPYDTSLEEGELVTEVRVEAAAEGEGSAYEKLKRKVGDYAMVGVAARVALGDDDAIERAGIGLTSVGITNLRSEAAADVLEGEVPDAELLRRAGEAASGDAEPQSDEHGDAEYKENMVRVLTQRALVTALDRAGFDLGER
ncbi:MAG TPA: xanthine dehydrogenase family protein subunit M, partial [Halobacteriales archaeon]|nr:xanthine dehydrogenase family protein subunit M [Halobacteriales archaeon]